MNKKEARSYMKRTREDTFSFRMDQILEAERTIFEEYLKSDAFLMSSALLVYHSTDREFNTTRIVKDCFLSEKAIFMPRIVSSPSAGGKMDFVRVYPDTKFREVRGIKEPEGEEIFSPSLFPSPIEVLIPGLAFDRKGNRVGYGGGYYDRFLSRKEKERLHLTALCFSFQILDSIEIEPHDIPVDLIFTEREKITVSPLWKEF